MAEQRTGYFRSDGHRIGFATLGEGPPLVLPAWWVSNVVEDWKSERFRRFVQALANGKQVIRYDRLGCGMSDRRRPSETLSLAFEVATLRALLDHLGLECVSLVGGSFGGCTAVAFARLYPDRVDRLVLYGSFANGNELASAEVRHAMLATVRSQVVFQVESDDARVLEPRFAPTLTRALLLQAGSWFHQSRVSVPQAKLSTRSSVCSRLGD